MSDTTSQSSSEFGLDSQGRVIRVDPDQSQPILRLPSVEETLQRLGNTFNSGQSTAEHYSETSDSLWRGSSPEDDTSRNTLPNLTDTELSVDVADGSSTPNETSETATALTSEEDRKYCWVCFATDEDDATASWVKPCHCRGTTKWVHQGCIQRWVDVKQKGRAGEDVSCPQCNTEYIIIYPDMGPLVVMLDTMDSVIFRVCPFIAAGIVVGSIYWTAVTYGAVTVMQVVGHKDGLTMMEQADPLVLLVGLPTIPIMLVLGKMLRWEDQALSLLRRHASKVPILRHFLPSSYIEDERLQSSDVPPMSDPVSATRVLCGALLLPTIASICGKIFFESVNSNFQRTLLGGMAFITIKGAFKIYHKQQQYVRQCQRRIMDYTDSNIALYRRHQNGESTIS
ncbi:E3 ubiquitin-protein ligase MARCHF5 isoform X1 [Neodiprion pinetum]|uniref:E3 ubiquitin-protein ligase MARCHF5 n=1 Tax=Neodiprion lecontei TaxID=441921 RepID=A0A6J0C2L4_NEOLC|nr:E3 ubiquitin-protein ligase MARCHF5 isoform X1 [Neodiprion lecontei]XP_046409319.1 E3 ubiquitin-protein ligase MARCHF5-like isoform X1 [Neodiprion fabricii]XP_046409320.1 E3 ubiquitin-protein ligase MARCHF5-like isoform X1 [Neodiprion fabricii]XP_046409321.1 E3 ubiquitin-protein ligase MARCHF5-like isoform X1 [Neodiprion fabricii]XP_046409322.1 E3 ubiquitin-protein ligase MARCHF5-like isoform X1 [Neodiprion fabricii]XP_046409323.1 E3 ubiquitin-protein ligase MARCHF5-like isoform X1 [Neodipr